MSLRLLSLALLLTAACGRPAKDQALLDVKSFIQQNIDSLLAASISLQADAPAPTANGWNPTNNGAAVQTMRSDWKKARTAYEHVEGAIAVLFPELDISTDERYDGFVSIGPDNDLFDAISAGSASVVTDEIDTFTETGVALVSGAHLEADLIVTATGLDMVPFGGIELTVDDHVVDVPSRIVYQGMMLSDVPNMAFAFGYINQSWTLGADLSTEQVCRLLNHMDRHGFARCTPRASAETVPSVPFAALTSGYIQRALDRFPRQAANDPWQRQQNYARNRRALRRAPIDDPALEFARAAAHTRAHDPLAA